MDTFRTESDNNVNHEKETQEIQVLIPNPPQYSLAPMQCDLNRLSITGRDRSFCVKPEGTLSRRPSAIVTAIQREQRSSGTGKIFFEYDFIC